MIVYWLLLLPTALIAYILGSMDTVVLASNFAFKRNLLRLGKGNLWLSNFRRIYGIKGFLKLLLVEVIRDLIPILIGSILLGIKGHADAGRAFAGLCLVLGRAYPLLYGFKGKQVGPVLIAAALAVDVSAGIAALVVYAAVTLLTKYYAIGTVSAALVSVIVAILVVDDTLMRNLVMIAAALAIMQAVPAIIRILMGREERLANVQDVTYKFDERF